MIRGVQRLLGGGSIGNLISSRIETTPLRVSHANPPRVLRSSWTNSAVPSSTWRATNGGGIPHLGRRSALEQRSEAAAEARTPVPVAASGNSGEVRLMCPHPSALGATGPATRGDRVRRRGTLREDTCQALLIKSRQPSANGPGSPPAMLQVPGVHDGANPLPAEPASPQPRLLVAPARPSAPPARRQPRPDDRPRGTRSQDCCRGRRPFFT